MVDLLDRTSSEPATSSPAPPASDELPPLLDRDVRFGAAVYGSFLAAAVIGVADEEFGQRLKAFVVPREDADLSADDVRGHVKANLARFKVPREVEFLDSLPRNASFDEGVHNMEILAAVTESASNGGSAVKVAPQRAEVRR